MGANQDIEAGRQIPDVEPLAGARSLNDRSLIGLQHGALELELVPEVGGAINRFAFHGRDLMRPGGKALLEQGNVRAAGCFPLVPFSGRIADGRFTFAGEESRLEPNFPPEPHAIHGQGWQLPWEVRHRDERFAELACRHRVPATPLDYEARQTFRLEEAALEIELEVENTGDRPMPAGLGLHPYFVRTPKAALQARLTHMWLVDERNIPRERVELPEHLDFSSPLEVATLELDNGFDGWDGRAQIVWPEAGRRLTILADPPCDRLVIYVPRGKTYFCVEPATNANNGFNLLGDDPDLSGVRVLAPGERLTGCVRFEVA